MTIPALPPALSYAAAATMPPTRSRLSTPRPGAAAAFLSGAARAFLFSAALVLAGCGMATGEDGASEGTMEGASGQAPEVASGQAPDDAAERMGDPDSESPVVLITGSTGGLGREVARHLAAEGAHIIVHGRSVERGEALVSEIEEGGAGSARFYRADLASLDETRAFVRRVLDEYDRLDVLVNNAGVWADGPETRRLTDDGVELAFQVNYLSHFVLTRKLLPLLLEGREEAAMGDGEGRREAAPGPTAPARIINVASVAQRPLDFDDVMMDQDYSHGRGYAQSKLAQVLFSMDLARELSEQSVIVAALHPATMMDTDMVLSRGAEPRTSVDEGREAVVHLVTSADVESGSYYNGLRPARANDQAYDEEAQRQLRELARDLTGVR